MKVFNTLQMVVLLMASPTLLGLLYKATFVGAGPLFSVGVCGAVMLTGWVSYLVHEGLD